MEVLEGWTMYFGHMLVNGEAGTRFYVCPGHINVTTGRGIPPYHTVHFLSWLLLHNEEAVEAPQTLLPLGWA